MSRLRAAALIAFSIHLMAGLTMLLILRNGLDTNPDFQGRLTFIVSQNALWTSGWLVWTAAAIAILYFYLTFVSAHQLGLLAVVLTGAAVASDISAQAIEIGVLPGIAARVLSTSVGMELFMALHRVAVMMSGFVANGLYSLSALVLAWTARRWYPAWVGAAGLATGCFGLVLSAAVLLDSVAGMFWSNVVLIPCLLVWLAGVGMRT